MALCLSLGLSAVLTIFNKVCPHSKIDLKIFTLTVRLALTIKMLILKDQNKSESVL